MEKGRWKQEINMVNSVKKANYVCASAYLIHRPPSTAFIRYPIFILYDISSTSISTSGFIFLLVVQRNSVAQKPWKLKKIKICILSGQKISCLYYLLSWQRDR